MKVFGLVQARMGSARLPGKVMKPLAGIPLILHIHRRLSALTGLSGVVLATSSGSENDAMALLAADNGMLVARWPGDDDIAGRLTAALDISGADAFLKINADCPLADPALMQDVLEAFLAQRDADVACNKIVPSYPLGYSVELISARALRWCNDNLKTDEDRELVIKWILDRPDRFPAVSLSNSRDLSHLNLTVDTPDDYALMSGIFDALYPSNPLFGLDAVLDYLSRHTSESA